MLSAAIICGWAEGSWQTKAFRRMLTQKGYKVLKDPKDADIIIAHSAGCYADLEKYKAGQILLISPPMWPSRTLSKSAVLQTREDLKVVYKGNFFGWLKKVLRNWWYALTTPKSSYEVFHLSPKKLPHAKKHQRILLIRNRMDEFCHPEVAMFISKDRDYKYMEVNGGHDDCWTNPAPYVDLIKKHL